MYVTEIVYGVGSLKSDMLRHATPMQRSEDRPLKVKTPRSLINMDMKRSSALKTLISTTERVCVFLHPPGVLHTLLHNPHLNVHQKKKKKGVGAAQCLLQHAF